MRDLFPGHYRPTKEEFDELWKACVFAFDANVLLNIYRYSESTRKAFLQVLDGLRDRIWLPHQAALEYQENRLEVLSGLYAAYENIPKDLDAMLEKFGKSYPRHPFIRIDLIIDTLKQTFERIKTILKDTQSGHTNLKEHDDLRAALEDLFSDKVGKPYAAANLDKIHADGEKRYQKKIPPGYKDTNKDKDPTRKYGDVVLWFQLKEYAKENRRPLILITDDKKEDWWQEHKGETIGPRPELIQEMKSESNVQFYMYQSDRFIEFGQKHLGLQGVQAVEEVREIRKQDEGYKRDISDDLRQFLINALITQEQRIDQLEFDVQNPNMLSRGYLPGLKGIQSVLTHRQLNSLRDSILASSLTDAAFLARLRLEKERQDTAIAKTDQESPAPPDDKPDTSDEN
jgi:hypothetical protein